ncbi:MAG: response regulator transcription factor [Candidatus Schekmanbacteria bacterium]|nr:response regulator transcription factor [Candidatus Schekmanbacteria bacterium]
MQVATADPDRAEPIHGMIVGYDEGLQVLWCRALQKLAADRLDEGMVVYGSYVYLARKYHFETLVALARPKDRELVFGLRLPAALSVGDARGAPRVPVPPGELLLRADRPTIAAEIRELSVTGVGFQAVFDKLPPAFCRLDRLDVELAGAAYLEMPDSILRLVRRTGPRGEAAFRFLRIDEAARRFLGRYAAVALEQRLRAHETSSSPGHWHSELTVGSVERRWRVLVADSPERGGEAMRNRISEARPDITVLNVSPDDGPLQALRDYVPDLVIVEPYSRESGGFGLLEILQGSLRHGHVPVVVASTSARRQDVLRATRLGARAYLLKPVRPALLVQVLDKILPRSPEIAARLGAHL